MSLLSHITLSLPIPLPFPHLVACPWHPQRGHGSLNFCKHPLISLLSVVKIPGLIHSLVVEHLMEWNRLLFEQGFSAGSHPFLTKQILRLWSAWLWLSRDMSGLAEQCPLHFWQTCRREIDSLRNSSQPALHKYLYMTGVVYPLRHGTIQWKMKGIY